MNRCFTKNVFLLAASFVIFIAHLSAQKSVTYVLHTIKAGETLSGIAKESKTTVGDLMRANGMNSKSVLRVGANIKVPMRESNTVVENETPVVKPVATVVPATVAAPTIEQTTNNSVHIIKAGETLSAIARENKTTVGDIMRLNGMNSKSVLKIGEEIKLPNTDSKKTVEPFENQVDAVKAIVPVKAAPAVASSVVNPIKYTVVKGDNLYRLSKKFNVTEAQIEQWSGMKNDLIHPGQVLTVGQSADATQVITKEIPPVVTKEVVPAVTKEIIPLVKKDSAILKTPVALLKDTINTLKFVARDTNKVVAMPVVDSSIVAQKDTSLIEKINIDTIRTIAKQEIKEKPTVDVNEALNNPPPIKKYAKYVDEEGFFAGYFNRKDVSKNTTTGNVGIFKSSSGWNDKKYYILVNDINQGTIVRITANHKSICAKVVGPLPNIKEDTGLFARINTAAADALGIQDTGFGVVINY